MNFYFTNKGFIVAYATSPEENDLIELLHLDDYEFDHDKIVSILSTEKVSYECIPEDLTDAFCAYFQMHN